MGGGQRFLNQADHRAVGVAVLDAARDAGNRWIFPELLDEGFDRGPGSPRLPDGRRMSRPTRVDVTDTSPAGIDSLRAHRAYLDGLGRDFDPEEFLRG